MLDEFSQERHPRFGMSNPERMHIPHWDRMVENGLSAYQGRKEFGLIDDWSQPDWCFNRFGMTRTELADGRTICIGGEHEDFYDPDFYIYNDVVVLGPSKSIEIYGYPKGAFPPTDFHTATLTDNGIIVIGGLGYMDDRVEGFTPVYRLDSATYQFEKLASKDPLPGWIFNHTAELDAVRRSIVVKAGETIVIKDGRQEIRTNVDEFQLCLDDLQWEQLTDHADWRQFVLRPQDSTKWDPVEQLDDTVFQPGNVNHETLPKSEFRSHQITVQGVAVSVHEGSPDVRILFLGKLPDETVRQVVAGIRTNLETAWKQTCRVIEL
jgi:hypothetical protein